MKRNIKKKDIKARLSNLKKGESWHVLWSEYGSNTYLYGSRVVFIAKDNIEFENALMPPGTIIKKWFSKTNYQAMRIEPMLPMIDGEGRYSISADITTDEYVDDAPYKKKIKDKKKYLKNSKGWILKLVYFDRYDQEVGSDIVRDGNGEFKCPITTFSYELQLINAGVKRFHFHSITITELIDEE